MTEVELQAVEELVLEQAVLVDDATFIQFRDGMTTIGCWLYILSLTI